MRRRAKIPSIAIVTFRVCSTNSYPGPPIGAVQINSAGFRGSEVELTPPAGTTRIAFIGDSETFAKHLPERGTLPGAVEAIINRAQDETRFE